MVVLLPQLLLGRPTSIARRLRCRRASRLRISVVSRCMPVPAWTATVIYFAADVQPVAEARSWDSARHGQRVNASTPFNEHANKDVDLPRRRGQRQPRRRLTATEMPLASVGQKVSADRSTLEPDTKGGRASMTSCRRRCRDRTGCRSSSGELAFINRRRSPTTQPVVRRGGFVGREGPARLQTDHVTCSPLVGGTHRRGHTLGGEAHGTALSSSSAPMCRSGTLKALVRGEDG